ncbi:hypothetical protein, partial [Cardiobacterium hominis]|uniref:hypothetical protein n=1 Tax=Cardiobacterium hominis TaxID=2718 RepID=UPI00248F7BE0
QTAPSQPLGTAEKFPQRLKTNCPANGAVFSGKPAPRRDKIRPQPVNCDTLRARHLRPRDGASPNLSEYNNNE